ncbi:hypothetical protein LTR37_015445 [Vermiconidia calcicola]|uniref:Uncharacterized protein n=1 Tax=Vermiconidia calcicola TaxID=1690605 RepID=A0ACC3MQQ4_9PEZI|nr:hypothetical protein LTR37_015445 [Vermiconidia calcicola]
MSDMKPTKTFVYKSVGNLDLSLDLYLPDEPRQIPVVLWFHGGGLLQGRRDQLAAWMRKGVQTYKYACVSADYRLAPQTGVQDIFEDVKDCVNFIRNDLSANVDEGVLDVTRLAVSGSSAGGYLALLAGLYADPKPTVIIPIYPITDPLGSFFTNPQPPALGRYLASKEEMARYLDPKAEPVANCGPLPEDARMHMYSRMLDAANLAELLGISDPKVAAPFRISRCVYQHRLPPAYIVHGDADSAVGVEQADEVVGAMLGCGIEVQYERSHGKDHFLDTGADYENDAFFSFMLKHLDSRQE